MFVMKRLSCILEAPL